MSDVIRNCRLKMGRALDHREAINARIESYASGDAYEVLLHAHGEDQHISIREPDPDISVRVGELIYQCRSTLDHLFFELVKLNQRGITLPKGWERDAAFPLHPKRPDGVSSSPVPREKFGSLSRDWISDAAFTFIERLQPYNSGNVSTQLRAMHKFTNIDKHRYLHTAVGAVEVEEIAQSASGTLHSIGFPVKDGAELKPTGLPPEWVDVPMKMQSKLTPKIVLEDATIVDNVRFQIFEFEELVDELPSTIMWHIIPAFEYLYSHP